MTGVGFIMEELRLLKVFKPLTWEVAAAKSEAEDIIGRLAGRGIEPGGRLPSMGKGNGGFDAPIDERAAEAAAAWR